MSDSTRPRVQHIKCPPVGSDPNVAVTVLHDTGYVVAADAIVVIRIVPVIPNRSGNEIQLTKTFTFEPDPQVAGPVLEEAPDRISADGIPVRMVVTINLNLIAVKPIESIVGTNPDEALAILIYAGHLIAGKSLTDR